MTRLLAAAGFLAIPLSLCLSGHAAAAMPHWLSRPALFLHASGFLFWIGSLPPLLIALGRSPGEAAAPLARFSRIAPWPVAMILVSGAVLAAIQLGPEPQFWSSPYGAILAAKLALLLLAFSLAAWNRFWLTGPVLSGDGVATARLRRSMKLEILLIAGVLALAAGWRFTPPPRALAAAAAAPIELHLEHAKFTAELSLVPGQTGRNLLTLSIAAGDQASFAAQEVAISLSARDRGIEPVRRQLAAAGENVWQIPELSIPLPGAWDVELEVRASRYELVRIGTTITLP